MRLLCCLATCLVLLSAGIATGSVVRRCGTAVGDRAMVASMEAEVAAQCDCCGPPTRNAPCVLGAVKSAVRAGNLSRGCARKVLRDAIRACPRAAANTACSICNSDADCGPGEFCDCRLASCNKAGSVCVTRPHVCPQIVAPVCGCDGMTYANDCERQAAGACKRKTGPCVEAGGCLDTTSQQCTGAACSPQTPCAQPNEICSSTCGTPPPQGTCFDLVLRSCTSQACGGGIPCLSNQACLPVCPPPVVGKCFVTVAGICTDQSCGPNQPCTEPNEFCSPSCLGSGCTSDGDCNDGIPCTGDHCANGTCEHECLCVGPRGTASCCPGPSALCMTSCGSDASGTCGGSCPSGSRCTASPVATACGCVSPLGGPCGGNIFAPPPVCVPGLICEQSNPDVTGVCVEPCGNGAVCDGPCTRFCPDGTKVAGSCVGASDPTLPCTCDVECNPTPTPTVGVCGNSIDTCGGACPFVCPDGTTAMGRCAVVVVDPPGKIGEPVGPMCRCFADCPAPPTPTPGPCGSDPQCGGSCFRTCSDGTTVTGQCIPAPVSAGDAVLGGGCACTASCGPPPQCSSVPCGGSCAICPPCPPGTVCPKSPCRLGACQADPAGTCQCLPAHEPTPTPIPPQCSSVPCGGSCLLAPPCTAPDACPDFVALGHCDIATDGSCQCIREAGATPTPACATDADCNDDNSCTADRCVNGVCEHGCICATAGGQRTCCSGPSALCVAPCGSDAAGTCGGNCPPGASCETVSAPNGVCGCVSGPGGPCGGNLFAPPPVCAPGLVCHQTLPDVTGYCEKPNCVPLFTSGCSQTSDCCEPCENGTHAPCGVCINGTCDGAP